MKSLNIKLFALLLSLSLISVVCIFPYVLTLQGPLLQKANIPIQTLIIAQFIQSAIFFSVVILLGLHFTRKATFQLPIFEALLSHEDYKKMLKSIIPGSITLGIITALTIYILDLLFSRLGSQISTHQNYAPAWQTLLAAFYGGIAEEIVMRLFVMSLLTWLTMKITRKTQPSKIGIIVSIILSAIIFGLGHLPVTASLTKIDNLVIIRAIVLNGIGGIVFGTLFWKKGLESAMIAHFTADIFLLTFLPMVIK